MPLDIGHPGQIGIVEGHQMPIGGGMNIGFHVLIPQSDRIPESRQGVLNPKVGREQGTTAMSHRDELRLQETCTHGNHYA